MIVHVPEIREYFTKIQLRHKDPVGQPQEWFDIVVSNRIMRLWTAEDQKAPPKGWVQDGWEGQTPEIVKDQYALILVLRGAMNELLTSSDLPETQKEDLTALLGAIRLYKRADEPRRVCRSAHQMLMNCAVGAIRIPFARTAYCASKRPVCGIIHESLTETQRLPSSVGRSPSLC